MELNMRYDRKNYVDKLLRKRNNGLVKVVTGIRRVGKSFILNELLREKLIEGGFNKENIISFSFDSAFDLEKIGEDLLDIKEKNRKVDPHKFLPFIRELTKGEGPYVLLLDEIQELGNFEAVLNGYLRQNNVDVYVTGSNARTLSRDVSTEFGKRGDEIKVYPLSFSEFYEHSDLGSQKALNDYLRFGGMPTVANCGSDEEKAEELNGLLEKIYLRDVIVRNGVNNEAGLSALLDIMASNVGSPTNPKKIADSFQSKEKLSLSQATISKYLEYFENAFLLEQCARYDIKGKGYIETPKKYYFEDLGLRNSRLRFRQFDEGHLFENMVYLELSRRGYAIDVGTLFHSEPNHNGNYVRKEIEVDFVARKGDKEIYIQCCNTLPEDEKEKVEKRGLIKIGNSFKKILLVNKEIPHFYDPDGILTLGVFDFLLSEDSIERY